MDCDFLLQNQTSNPVEPLNHYPHQHSVIQNQTDESENLDSKSIIETLDDMDNNIPDFNLDTNDFLNHEFEIKPTLPLAQQMPNFQNHNSSWNQDMNFSDEWSNYKQNTIQPPFPCHVTPNWNQNQNYQPDNSTNVNTLADVNVQFYNQENIPPQLPNHVIWNRPNCSKPIPADKPTDSTPLADLNVNYYNQNNIIMPWNQRMTQPNTSNFIGNQPIPAENSINSNRLADLNNVPKTPKNKKIIATKGIPTYYKFKPDHFVSNGYYDFTCNNISVRYSFEDEIFKGHFMSGNLYNVTELILQNFLGKDLSKFNLNGHQFLLINKSKDTSKQDLRVSRVDSSKQKIPEELVSQILEFVKFVVPESYFEKVTLKKVTNRILSKICSRHSERIRRISKKGKGRNCR